MRRITILSEDRVFSTLLSRNLEAQGHQVDIHLVNGVLPLSFLASPATWNTDIWVLDLNWHSDASERTYEVLSEWCRKQSQPAVLLVDNSWDVQATGAFGAATALTKPFSMMRFLQSVQQLADTTPQGNARPQGQGDENMTLREKSTLIFQKWKPVYFRMLVPLDGSKLAESVLPVVATLADALGMEVMLLHVVPDADQQTRTPTPSQQRASEDISNYLKGVVQQLSRQGLKVGWRVTSGSPVEDIIRYANEAPADLIAMSTHGMGGDGKSTMGSVAAAVLERQTRPVLLIKPDKVVADW